MKQVCFLGASTVEGMGVEGGLGWVGRLALLNRLAGHRPARAGLECVAEVHLLMHLGLERNQQFRICFGRPVAPSMHPVPPRSGLRFGCTMAEAIDVPKPREFAKISTSI